MGEPGYYRYPTIHGDTIVFACEDDLWTVSTGGGVARRLTAGHGECGMPRFSPDGSLVAFVGRDEGHPEVFVIPAAGGVAERLTYMGGATLNVCGWSQDGKEIFFTSEARSPFFKHSEAFAVSIGGGLPRPLELGHVQSLSLGANNKCAIGRNNNDPARWKRYRGGTAGEIWVDAKGKGEFVKLEPISGNLVLPMWLKDRVYFLSDHNGTGNLFSCRPTGDDLKQHTHHTDYFVRFPSTDGRRIVYSAGAEIFLLDPLHESRGVEIQSPAGTQQVARRFVEARDYLEHFSLHPRGESLALIARGQPLTMGNWEGAVIQHGSGSRVRYRAAEWLPDGERFVVLSDASGRERLEIHRADQNEAPVVIDGDLGRVIEMRVAPTPASNMVALSNHRQELLIIDLKTKKIRELDCSQADRISGLTWSADGRWLAYSYPLRQSTSIIRIADCKSGTIHDVTDEVSRDFSPSFDPEGRYLYFLGGRDYHPVYDTLQFDLGFPASVRPFVIVLRKDVPSPFLQKPRPLVGGDSDKSQDRNKVAAAKGKDGQEVSKSTSKSESKSESKSIDIDFDGIHRRVLGFPMSPGRYVQLVASKGRILVNRLAVKGIGPGYNFYAEGDEGGVVYSYLFEEGRMAPLLKDVVWMRMAADNQTLVYKSRNRLRVVDAQMPLPPEGADAPAPSGSGRKSGWIDLGRAQTLVQPQQEWHQMYEEAWRLQRDQFWDERMSDINWNLVHDRYAALLKRVRTRSELSDIIWEMQGELGTSHAYEVGGDHRISPQYYRGFLGADFVFDAKAKGYRVTKILRGFSWSQENDSPLAVPGVDVMEGDVILAVDGRGVSPDCTIDELLINKADREVNLTIVNKKTGRRNVVVRTLRSEAALRYRVWVEGNREYVHERTQGRVGYVHIPDMGPMGYAEFHFSYLSEVHRDALIIDARYNRGGHVSPLLLEKLSRKRVGYDVSRWGLPEPYPPESVAGPMVCLTNQFAGSDGDIFSHCFKLYQLGPLVGKRTWGGVIGIHPRHRLVDGTVTTQPEFSFWFKDVGWRVENYGTDPDHDVDIRPQDYMQGRDPQMEKALSLIMRELSKNPVNLPDFADKPSLPLPHQLKVAGGKKKAN